MTNCKMCGAALTGYSSRKKYCGSAKDRTGCAYARVKALSTQWHIANPERVKKIHAKRRHLKSAENKAYWEANKEKLSRNRRERYKPRPHRRRRCKIKGCRNWVRSKGGKRLYCSPTCESVARWERRQRKKLHRTKCAWCDKKFNRDNIRTLYCNDSCRKAAQRKQMNEINARKRLLDREIDKKVVTLPPTLLPQQLIHMQPEQLLKHWDKLFK